MKSCYNSLLLGNLSKQQGLTLGHGQSVAGFQAISEYVRQNEQNLIITAHPLEALLLSDYLRCYRDDVVYLCDHELMPFDSFSPSGHIAGQRNAAIFEMLSRSHFTVVTSVAGVFYKLPPKSFYWQNCLNLQVGQQLCMNSFVESLCQSGFESVSEVSEVGQFFQRGSLLDFFPAASTNPVRLEFFDDTIESIRSFCPSLQITLEKVHSIKYFPLCEYITNELNLTKTIKNFKMQTSLHQGEFYKTLAQGKFPNGFQFFMPMLYDELTSIFDYVTPKTKVISYGDIASQHQILLEKFEERFLIARSHFGFTPYPAKQVALESLDRHYDVKILHDPLDKEETLGSINLKVKNLPALEGQQALVALANLRKRHLDKRWLFAVRSGEKSANFLQKLQQVFGVKQIIFFKTLEEFVDSQESLGCFQGSFPGATLFDDYKVIFASESWVFSLKALPKEKKQPKVLANLMTQANFKPGDLVVHKDHGIALYQGLKLVNLGQVTFEMNELHFADQDKLYVPIDEITSLSPYFSLTPQEVELHKLGSNKWKKQKDKAFSQAYDQASELLELYAARENSTGMSFQVGEEYQQFCSQFPYQETDDQIKVIDDVLADMQSARCMDRLICGDVGFGKTEVAMRAIFVAVQSGSQVAFLAPTTLLAQQHYESLLSRFSQWPVRIELMIRQSGHAQTYEDLEAGKIDIVVGTHKIIQPKAKYRQLGLIIIDEEHRFGVRQKEQLKKLRHGVDVLCMTATPIPRTLSMSFHGLRDLSIIATPPERRLRVETMIYQQRDSLLKEATERELLRGGQVFYVHNDISTIEAQADKLRRFFPQCQVGVVHGQMTESQQERVMSKFYHQDLDILVGTTIIETGLDVPNANTIFISGAHNLGLAQLHQLRGRVGRSYHQAYAYLFIPAPIESLPKVSQYRLQAIYDNQGLGAGFQLASEDLEIRGAGSLLGDKQSGHVQDIGLSTYKKLLEKARAELTGQKTQLDPCAEIELFISAFIPQDQIPCPYLRLKTYRLWQEASDLQQLKLYHDLFIDRFGQMLPETKNKYRLCALKLKAQKLGIAKIKQTKTLLIEFHEHFTYGDNLITLAKCNHKILKFKGPLSCSLNIQLAPDRRLDFCQELIDQLECRPAKLPLPID